MTMQKFTQMFIAWIIHNGKKINGNNPSIYLQMNGETKCGINTMAYYSPTKSNEIPGDLSKMVD